MGEHADDIIDRIIDGEDCWAFWSRPRPRHLTPKERAAQQVAQRNRTSARIADKMAALKDKEGKIK